jgi:transposase
VGGFSKVMTEETAALIALRYAAGDKIRAIATEFGVHESTVCRVARRLGVGMRGLPVVGGKQVRMARGGVRYVR